MIQTGGSYVLRNLATGEEYAVPAASGLRLGRMADNDVVLADEKVSRRHATVWIQDSWLFVRDENSTNGTLVDGRRISAPTPLYPGAQLQVGTTVFLVLAVQPDQPPYAGARVQELSTRARTPPPAVRRAGDRTRVDYRQPPAAPARRTVPWLLLTGIGAMAVLLIAFVAFLLLNSEQPVLHVALQPPAATLPAVETVAGVAATVRSNVTSVAQPAGISPQATPTASAPLAGPPASPTMPQASAAPPTNPPTGLPTATLPLPPSPTAGPRVITAPPVVAVVPSQPAPTEETSEALGELQSAGTSASVSVTASRPPATTPAPLPTATDTLRPTATPSWTATPSPAPTATATTPTSTPLPPTATSTPTVTPSPLPAGCTPNAKFVSDVTVPDNSLLNPGEVFTKTWRVQSSGCAPWPEGARWVFVSGDKLEAPESVPVPAIQPNVLYDVSVVMKAPSAPGNYKGYWQLQTRQGEPIGKSMWVAIVVAAPAPAPSAETPALAVLHIANHTGDIVLLRMTGPKNAATPQTYEFRMVPNEIYTQQLPAGAYDYTGEGCGDRTSGTKNLPAAEINWEWRCQ